MKKLNKLGIQTGKTLNLALMPLFVAALFSARPLHSTEVIPLSLAESVRQADAIVVGTVTSQQSRWGDASKRWMLTDFTFAVEDTLFSSNSQAMASTVRLTYWGGTMDGETQTISDLRLPAVGEHLMMLLRPGWNTEAGFTPVVGFNHGLFSISISANDGRPLVMDFAGQNLSLTARGQITRDHLQRAANNGEVDLALFKQWLRTNISSIKASPSELAPLPDASDPRLIRPMAKTPQIPGTSSNDAGVQTSDPVRPPSAPAGPSAAELPGRPMSSATPVGDGREISAQPKMHSQKYSTSHQAHLPIVVNQLPASFTPWSPEDQYQMSKWNYYDDVFRVRVSPTGTYGWPNGVFDLAGWPSSADLQRVYGSPWSATTVGITFLRYDGNGWIIEADIALNPAFGFTLDDEWVYDGSNAQPFRYTLLHELGHMHGLDHNFTFLSVMNYLPAPFRAFAFPYADDAGGIRFEYPGNVVNRTDLGIYLYYCPGSTAVYESTFPSSVVAGNTLTVNDYHVENVGTTTIITPTVEWYLTVARNYSSSYYYIGSSTYSSLAPFSYFYPDSVSRTFTVPSTVPSGTYYLAAFIRNDGGASQSSFPFYNNMAFSRSTISVTHLPPSNDQCFGAIALANGAPFAEDTQDATSVGDPAPSCQPNFGKGVWFSFTPAENGLVTISTCDSSFDTVLQAFTGACGALVPMAGGCDDDSGPSCQSLRASLQFNGIAGTQYFILAGGFGNGSGTLNIVANSAPVRLGGCGMTGAGEFHLDINGPAGAACTIQVSSDLVNWTNLGYYPIPAGGATTIQDPSAIGQPRRFYRAMMR